MWTSKWKMWSSNSIPPSSKKKKKCVLSRRHSDIINVFPSVHPNPYIAISKAVPSMFFKAEHFFSPLFWTVFSLRASSSCLANQSARPCPPASVPKVPTALLRRMVINYPPPLSPPPPPLRGQAGNTRETMLEGRRNPKKYPVMNCTGKVAKKGRKRRRKRRKLGMRWRRSPPVVRVGKYINVASSLPPIVSVFDRFRVQQSHAQWPIVPPRG